MNAAGSNDLTTAVSVVTVGTASSPTDSHGLGRFREIQARQAVGGNEDTNFTPWLARNIDVLSTAIGLRLSVLGDGDEDLIIGKHIEVAIGGFYLDIRATDELGRIVAIENQYGMTDHRHLGQLITYASGIGADVLVWIAESFSPPHLQAIQWLNSRTDNQCGVFAVRARFLQIGASPAAPAFEVMARPSEWAREMRRLTQADAEKWTIDTFLEECDEVDRELVMEVLNRTTSTGAGPHPPLWFGSRPNGSIYVHPEGGRYAPIFLWLNSKGRAMFTGAWANYSTVAGHEGFRHIAQLMGQDHQSGKAAGRPLGDFDLDTMWQAAVATAREVNTVVKSPADDGLTPT